MRFVAPMSFTRAAAVFHLTRSRKALAARLKCSPGPIAEAEGCFVEEAGRSRLLGRFPGGAKTRRMRCGRETEARNAAAA